MSFTIKCDACGHTSKWRQRKVRNNYLKGEPIRVHIDDSNEDEYPIIVLACGMCGHRVAEI